MPSSSFLDRRDFLGSTLGGLAFALSSGGILFADDKAKSLQPTQAFDPDMMFLTWQRDPTTTMTVQWVGASGNADELKVTCSPHGKDQWSTGVAPKTRDYPMTNLRIYRAELTDLTPGTEYEFKVGQSKPFRFRSMPAKATDSFQFISGGDCGVGPAAVAGNILAAKQDPMFALIGGDLGYDNGTRLEASLKFVRNYAKHMIDSQKRLIPLVVCIGNHEVRGGYNASRKDGTFFFALFDCLFPERTFATLDFGDYLSLVLLDTGHVAPIPGEQTDWLDRALAERVDRPHLIAVNHVPAYPSFRPPREGDRYEGTGALNRKHWVPLFEKHNVDFVLEHHDHTFKRTHPLKDGLIDPNGILYLGDGSWGKLRSLNKIEKRPYLAMANDSYHITLHRIEGERRFHMAMEGSGKIVDICMTQKKPRGNRG